MSKKDRKYVYGGRTDEGARHRSEASTRSAVEIVDVPVDADANPSLPTGLKYGEHRPLGKGMLVAKDGELRCFGKKITLIPCENALGVMRSEAELMEDIQLLGHAPLNANFRDALREHSALIPEDWSGKRIFFPSTSFALTPGGDRYIPFLYEVGRRDWFPHNMPAAPNPKDTFFGKKAFIAVL